MGRSSSGSPQRVLDAQKAVDLAMNRLWNGYSCTPEATPWSLVSMSVLLV